MSAVVVRSLGSVCLRVFGSRMWTFRTPSTLTSQKKKKLQVTVEFVLITIYFSFP